MDADIDIDMLGCASDAGFHRLHLRLVACLHTVKCRSEVSICLRLRRCSEVQVSIPHRCISVHVFGLISDLQPELHKRHVACLSQH